MKNNKFLLTAVLAAALFWFSDVFLHYFLYGEATFEIIPTDFNELWMRTTIVILMVAFGFFADHTHKKNVAKEKLKEAARIYNSMLQASHHILNNLLNQLLLFRMEAEKASEFDRHTLQLFDETIDEAKALIRNLSDIESITDSHILASIAPKPGPPSSSRSNPDSINP